MAEQRGYLMPRRRATFTESDLKRAIKAVQAVGLLVGAVEIDRDGRIRVIRASEAINPVDQKRKVVI